MFNSTDDRHEAAVFCVGALVGFAVGMLIIAAGAGVGYLVYLFSN